MAIPYVNNIDLNKFQIFNLRIQQLASAPGAPVTGLVYYDTVANKFYGYNGSGWTEFGGGAGGAVTSVGLSLPSIFSVTGSPVTTTGTLTATLASQTANTAFLAPDGSAGAPTFRALLANDIPNLSTAKLTSGILGVARGGTNIDGSTAANGNLLIGNGTGYSLATLTQGTGMTITNGSGTITIANAGVTSLTGTANRVTVSASTGSVTLSGPQDIHSGATPTFAQINVSADPSSALQVATKQYVDALSVGLRDYKESVKVASSSNVASISGLLTIDSYTVVAGDRVLLFGQSTASQNGIYIAAAGAWARSTDFVTGTTSGITLGLHVYVENGTNNGGAGYVLSSSNAASPSTSINIGTNNITFSRFAGSTLYTFGTGLYTNGSAISVGNFTLNGLIVGAGSSASATILAPGSQFNILVAGASGVPTWGTINLASAVAVGSSVLGLANGGTGGTSALTARTALAAAGKYTTTITGDGTTSTFLVTHNLGSQSVVISVSDNNSPRQYQMVECNSPTGGNTANIVFGSAPTNGTIYNVTVIG